MDVEKINNEHIGGRIFLIVSSVFFTASMFNANTAFLTGGFGFLIAIVLFIHRIGNLRDKKNINWMYFIACSFLIASFPVGKNISNFRIEHTMEPYIIRLEDYKNIHGKYPKAIEELGFGKPSCPNDNREPYRSTENGERYMFICHTFFQSSHLYTSSEKVWSGGG